MFLTPAPGLDPVDPDPALLAFVKCHITSPAKWEVLRVLASHDGAWVGADQFARATHRPPPEIARALQELVADDVVESTPDKVSYRLPADEPTSVVLRRLFESATHSQELRAIIAAHLQHLRQQGQTLRSTAAA
jgi:DNA-binding IclR family transcriptional regulator